MSAIRASRHVRIWDTKLVQVQLNLDDLDTLDILSVWGKPSAPFACFARFCLRAVVNERELDRSRRDGGLFSEAFGGYLLLWRVAVSRFQPVFATASGEPGHLRLLQDWQLAPLLISSPPERLHSLASQSTAPPFSFFVASPFAASFVICNATDSPTRIS
ncbi:hypothetical protein D9619_013538 [Psilocybe cf. subviscida]|uniref:Uncharacterized protein n=1 Tax=Psilocybe cf. subviscida TaxID=2480587 RepID=A0A8H5BIV5_9AGAR|nr:hypothetical protein D9619_013538 [Psilocybe cf. subviscida]